MGDKVCVGAITGAFGVRGEVRVKSFCADPAAIGDYGPLSDADNRRAFTLTITRPVKGGFAVRLSGVKTKEEADALKGTRLYAARDALPALPDDEFYQADLVGLAVVDTGGVARGQVHAVLNHGAGDLLEVRRKGQSATTLVPFTKEIVPTVDLSSGQIVVDPPDGLFEGD
ncbi:ribosome maturation factor RimM [Rhodobacteraceae bacterium W635]|uniref:ribosome maturation factor RimM n=1 Tax=Nioella halotolerans TaxID=2303578 RepID=UPI000E3E7340|nr:ribosome maturation factor RimM [Rhodobacteraceae bacterium W635]